MKTITTNVLTTVSLILMSCSMMMGQAYFLEKGQSAFSLGGQVSTAEDYYSLGASGTYTINGIVDLGLVVGYIHDDEDDIDASGYLLRPYIEIQLLEQSDDIPLNLTAHAAYEFAQLQSELVEDIGIEHDINIGGFDIGAALSYQIDAGNLLIQPYIGIRYVSATYEVDVSDPSLCFTYGICDFEDETSGIGFGLGVPLIFKAAENFLTLTPRLSFYDGNSSFNLSLQYVIPN